MEKISSSSPAKRILLVGMKLSSECRERLTWIVARLTIPGDHVIAVHVLQSSSSTALSSELDPATRKELDETFQGVLGVYQGLCTLKQIKLDIKVVVGASVKECLVDAAKLEDATKLILGTSRFVPTGLSTSLAKYCLKRLPSSCSVTIIDRGKVIFERPRFFIPGKEVSSCAQTCTPSVLQRGIMKRLSCSSSRHQASEFDTSGTDNDSPGGSNDNNPGSSNSGRSSVVLEANLSDSDRSYPASPVSVLHPNTDEFKPPESKESQDHLQGSSMTCEDGKALQGWPLRAFPLDKVVSSPSREPEERELSVVNWALQLPNRSQRRREALECSSARDSVSSSSSEFGCEQKLLSKCRSAPPPRERSLLLECLRQEVEAPLEQEEASKLNDEKPAETASSLSLSQRLQLLYTKNTSAAVKFDAEELLKATSNLSSKNLVGRGGCSQVFKGTLANGQAIAVKSLNEVTADSEGELVTPPTPKNVCWCTTLPQMGTWNSACTVRVPLESRSLIVKSPFGLDQEKTRKRLFWTGLRGERLQLVLQKDSSISTTDARGLKRKKTNLFADLGLWTCKMGTDNNFSHNLIYSSTSLKILTSVYRYLAPEYFMFGKLNEKTDVYSFGVVLLELITVEITYSNKFGVLSLSGTTSSREWKSGEAGRSETSR